MASIKILTCGDVKGRISDLLKRLVCIMQFKSIFPLTYVLMPIQLRKIKCSL